MINLISYFKPTWFSHERVRYVSRAFSNSSPFSLRPAVTIAKRCTPCFSLWLHSVTIWCLSRKAYSSIPVQWWADCAQNLQSSEHRPLLPLMIKENQLRKRAGLFCIVMLPFVLCKIKSSSLTDELCIELEQPFRFIRVIFRVTDPAFSCDFMQFQCHTRSFNCICIDSRKACI